MRGEPRWQGTAGGTAQQDHLRFALALHERVAENGQNSCFSPYSVASALSLVAAGAKGDTARELVELLAGSGAGISEHVRLLGDAARLAAREGHDEPVLDVANTLWAWQELAVSQEFGDELATWPSGGVRAAPFRDDPEAARQLINADVSERTHGLIPELVPDGAVDGNTVASLVNALYLRVAWQHQFETGSTADGDFHSPVGTVRVPMMAQSEQLGYNAQAGWQAVGLPAAGGVQAVVLLPDGSLAEQESELDVSRIERLIAGMTEQTVDLRMPRFRLDMHSPLESVLHALGVQLLFTTRADLRGISADHRIYVDSVQHQAVLRMDERGLEGAAATAAVMRLVSMPIPNVTVRVDRPFLLLVRHADTGAVYFFARVTRP